MKIPSTHALPLMVAACLVVSCMQPTRAQALDPANQTEQQLFLPEVNITFTKEITLTVQPPGQDDYYEPVSSENQQKLNDYLSAGLKMLDPIFHFFDQFWTGQDQQQV